MHADPDRWSVPFAAVSDATPLESLPKDRDTPPAWLRRRGMLALAAAGATGWLACGPAPGSAAAPIWRGPTRGPRARAGLRITVLAEDLRNGGVLGAAQGLREAARELRWALRVLDAGGSTAGRRKVLEQARSDPGDGTAVCGSDAAEIDALCRKLGWAPPNAVGWHVAERPGRLSSSVIATNISTDPLEVAQRAAEAARPAPGQAAGVVIVTDSRFGIALTKSRAMQLAIQAMAGATVLEVVDLPISGSADAAPALVRRLAAQHGPRWTHLLAINDIYFDHAVPVLIALGHPQRHVQLISAGDGSASALVRIQAGTYQTGTVAEPLNLQGWQMADELNRLAAGEPVSGFVTPATLVTRQTLAQAKPPVHTFEPQQGYRDAYRAIWFSPPGGR